MRHFHIPFAVAFSLLATGAAYTQSPGKIGVTVSGLRNDDGSVRCALFNSPNGFREPGREFKGVVAPIRGQSATCTFAGVPAGTYAVAVFHAEKNETRLETGAFGKPKQGYGFSNNPSSTFGPPGFSAAAFQYAGANQTLRVNLQY